MADAYCIHKNLGSKKIQGENRSSKLQRLGSNISVVLDSEVVESETRKPSSSQFKGVVPQPNGRWGSQIYEKHQRVWLGTFNNEEEAAKIYDIAAQRFRGSNAIINFSPLSKDEDEFRFLHSHSKYEIVDMLRKHTYYDELQQSIQNQSIDRDELGRTIGGATVSSSAKEHLFDKIVTPSDVGKLNRLVIPKQQAEKHFPLQVENNSKGVLLNFEDTGGKVWRFRYSYWNSSQSYVLTKGWSQFVKEKSLKAGDVVSFQRSISSEKKFYVDWKPRRNMCQPQPCQVVRLFGVNILKIHGSLSL